MHYIVGTEVIIPAKASKVIRPGTTSRELQSNKKSRAYSKHIDQFQSGSKYIISRIYKTSGHTINYIFTSTSSEQVTIEFDNIREAEDFISDIRSETVPDYKEIYDKSTD